MVRRPVRTLLATLASLLVVLPAGVAQERGSQGDTLSSVRFARASDDGSRLVSHIGPGALPGSILVLTEHDVREFDAAGTRVRINRFPNELWRPFTARFSTSGPQRIVGVKSGFFRSWVDVLDDSAQPLARLKGWQYGMVEVADVLGDAAQEVLVRYQDGVAILSEAGARLAFIRSPRFLYHFRTIPVPDSPKRGVAMWMWIDAKRGVDVSVMRGDGSTLAAWHEDESERLNVFSVGGEEGEGLWSAVPGRFIERTATGTIRRTFAVPDRMRFRYIDGSALAGGWKVFVGSMGTVGSLVCVFDAGGVLVGRSTLPLPSLGFYVPDPNGDVFLVGTGEHVLRYDVSSLRRPAALP